MSGATRRGEGTMEKFTASNGVEISVQPDDSGECYLLGKGGAIEGGSRRWTVATGNEDGVEALREFFRHERDQELGRWRWPENPDCVVYPVEAAGHTGSDYQECAVLNEKTGQRQEFGSDLPQCNGGLFREAARAYFAAHPEPKPWHDAKPGEVWVLDTQHGELALQVLSDGSFDNSGFYYEKDDPNIKSGRRIWPEVSDAS